MAKKEVKTDLWVSSQLKECGIEYDAQGSDVKELDEALKTASKRGTGKAGYPEYVSVVDDYVIVIEDIGNNDAVAGPEAPCLQYRIAILAILIRNTLYDRT